MRTLLLMTFLWNILTLNQFNTDEHLLSPFYSAVVLQKQLLYFQNISIKSHQSNLLSFASGILPSPPQELLQGPSNQGEFQRKDQNHPLKTKECTQRMSSQRGFVGVSFLFLFLVCTCVYIFCKVELQKENMVRGTL